MTPDGPHGTAHGSGGSGVRTPTGALLTLGPSSNCGSAASALGRLECPRLSTSVDGQFLTTFTGWDAKMIDPSPRIPF